MSDDEIIGLKSTSIKFKDNIKLFVSVSYLVTISMILFLFKEFIGLNIFSLFLIFFIFAFIYQLFKFKKNKPKNYLKIFKFNNYTGLFLFLTTCSINL